MGVQFDEQKRDRTHAECSFPLCRAEGHSRAERFFTAVVRTSSTNLCHDLTLFASNFEKFVAATFPARVVHNFLWHVIGEFC